MSRSDFQLLGLQRMDCVYSIVSAIVCIWLNRSSMDYANEIALVKHEKLKIIGIKKLTNKTMRNNPGKPSGA